MTARKSSRRAFLRGDALPFLLRNDGQVLTNKIVPSNRSPKNRRTRALVGRKQTTIAPQAHHRRRTANVCNTPCVLSSVTVVSLSRTV
eukprot:2349088-Prymnesium_polylepis.1